MKNILITALALGSMLTAGAQTTRELVVADKEGNLTTFPAEQVDGILFQPQPEYMTLNEAFNGSYEEIGPLGIYGISFATNKDAQGNPAGKEDLVISLVMAGPWSESVMEPKLPAGYYRIGRSDAEWTFDVTKSAVIVQDDNGNPTPSMIIDGSVDVRLDDADNYDVRIELVMFTGATIDMRYKGPINLPSGYSPVEPFTEPVDITFTHGQGRFWGDWFYPFAADLALEFYAGTIEDNTFKDGYELYISLYEPKPEDEMAPNQRVADGVYEVETRQGIQWTYLPFRFSPGERTEIFGQEYITRTRLTYYGPDGSRKLGLISGGTFTVSGNGSVFSFDFITEEGISVKGTFNGVPAIENRCDNDEKAPKRPYSTLTENVELDFLPGTVGIYYNEGHSILNDANTVMLMVTHPSMTDGDYISIDMLTEADGIPDGTFEIGGGLAAGHVIPGEYDYGGGMLFSWYGDLGEVDDDGYNTKFGPLASGTVTISTLSNDQRQIVYNAMDDAGHSITGTFTGVLLDANEFAEARAKAAGRINKISTRKNTPVRKVRK